jgi:hypothetical protein
MQFFIAGIMQGSHTAKAVHDQDYRAEIAAVLDESFPDAHIYDPRAEHTDSLDYSEMSGREVFFHHNRMCVQVDALVAVLPSASMGTAVEMWEAYRGGAAVISISPMQHNWVVKFLSHRIYPDIERFSQAVRVGEVGRIIEQVRSAPPPEA